MTDFVFKTKKRTAICLLLLTFLFVTAIFIGLESFFEKASKELVDGWYLNEEVNLQQGNVLSSVTKLQRSLTSSQLLKGVLVLNRSDHVLINFGKVDANAVKRMSFGPELRFINPGLFKRYYYIGINDLKVIIFTAAPVLVVVFVGIVIFLICLLLMFHFLITRSTQQEERIKAQFETNAIKLKLEFGEYLGNLATQLAHDIRSPLTALNMITSKLNDQLEEKILLNNATERINEIADSLLSKSRAIQQKPPVETTKINTKNLLRHNLGTVLEAIVNEKVIQYSDLKHIIIEKDFAEGYGLYSNIDKVEFCRIISNLIDNSIEAIVESGFIKISIRKHQISNMIIIHDSGKGMSRDLILQIGRKNFSFGKAKGSGLGLFHAKKTIEEFAGALEIESRESVGTMVSIKLPATGAS